MTRPRTKSTKVSKWIKIAIYLVLALLAEYVEETGNHVMYRVTPHFEGTYLLASGVQMEAYSVEDDGKGVCFNVYVYNAQPGITIDYETGDSRLTEND